MNSNVTEYYIDGKIVLKNELCQEQNNQLDYSELDNKPFENSVKVLLHTFCAYGDYINCSSIEKANVQYLKETYKDTKGMFIITGGYGYEGVVVTEKFLEEHNIIKQLDNYPVFDEQILSIIEDEMHDEEWDNYESEDFMKLLLEKFPQQEEKIQELFDYDKLYSLYYECTNLYQLTPECDGYNWIFHTDFMCEKLSEEYIKNFNVEE